MDPGSNLEKYRRKFNENKDYGVLVTPVSPESNALFDT